MVTPAGYLRAQDLPEDSLSSYPSTYNFIGIKGLDTGTPTLFRGTLPAGGGGGGGSSLAVRDEGANLTTAATSLDFTGAGVTATNTGGAVTINIPGGVTSVGLSVPSIFTVSGSPVTSSGTLGFSLPSLGVRNFLASPINSTGVPDFRPIDTLDLPSFLDNNARVGVRLGGTLVGTRRRINFIEGSNVTLSVSDDNINEAVNVTINSSGLGSGLANIPVSDEGSPQGNATSFNFTGNVVATVASNVATVNIPATGREVLTSNRTYFVSENGNDSNSGLNSISAFRQISKAIEVIEKLDLNGFNVTIQVADGTYNNFRILRGLVGGNCTILGNPTSPQNCIIQEVGTDGYGIDIQNSWGFYTINGFEIRVNFTNNSVVSVATGNADKVCLRIYNSSINLDNIRYNSTAGGNGYHLFLLSSQINSNVGSHNFIGNAYCAINCSQSNVNGIDTRTIGWPNNTATQITFNNNVWGFNLGSIILLQGNIDFFNRRFSGSWSGGNFGRIEAGSVRVRHPQLPSDVQTASTQNGGIFIVTVG